MLLAIDSGNTNVLFAVYDGDERRGEWRSSTGGTRTADEYAVWLMQLMAGEGVKPADIDGAIIANVVPAATFDLVSLCRRYFDVEPLQIGDPAVDLGIEVRVPNPEEVGADRLVNAVGAAGRYELPLIIIDFGTATTFDVVGKSGAYEGGTATVPAMQSGIYWGYVAMIEGLVRRIEAEYGTPMTVVATGGLAPLFNRATEAIDHLDGDLTIRGLLTIYQHNRAKA